MKKKFEILSLVYNYCVNQTTFTSKTRVAADSSAH